MEVTLPSSPPPPPPSPRLHILIGVMLFSAQLLLLRSAAQLFLLSALHLISSADHILYPLISHHTPVFSPLDPLLYSPLPTVYY